MYEFIFNSPLLFVETKIGMKSYSMTQLNGYYNSKLYIYRYIYIYTIRKQIQFCNTTALSTNFLSVLYIHTHIFWGLDINF